ncbi:TPA: fimbrial biogenesis chaperone, partial [Klebsiella pneumoniae]
MLRPLLSITPSNFSLKGPASRRALFCIQRKAMFRTLLNLTVSCALLLSSIAHAGIVVEST